MSARAVANNPMTRRVAKPLRSRYLLACSSFSLIACTFYFVIALPWWCRPHAPARSHECRPRDHLLPPTLTNPSQLQSKKTLCGSSRTDGTALLIGLQLVTWALMDVPCVFCSCRLSSRVSLSTIPAWLYIWFPVMIIVWSLVFPVCESSESILGNKLSKKLVIWHASEAVVGSLISLSSRT